VAAVLAERWQDVLVEAPETAKNIVEELRRRGLGRAALVTNDVIEADALPPHPAIDGLAGMLFDLIGGEQAVPAPLRDILRPVVLVETLDVAIAAWRSRPENGARIVT